MGVDPGFRAHVFEFTSWAGQGADNGSPAPASTRDHLALGSGRQVAATTQWAGSSVRVRELSFAPRPDSELTASEVQEAIGRGQVATSPATAAPLGRTHWIVMVSVESPQSLARRFFSALEAGDAYHIDQSGGAAEGRSVWKSRDGEWILIVVDACQPSAQRTYDDILQNCNDPAVPGLESQWHAIMEQNRTYNDRLRSTLKAVMTTCLDRFTELLESVVDETFDEWLTTNAAGMCQLGARGLTKLTEATLEPMRIKFRIESNRANLDRDASQLTSPIIHNIVRARVRDADFQLDIVRRDLDSVDRVASRLRWLLEQTQTMEQRRQTENQSREAVAQKRRERTFTRLGICLGITQVLSGLAVIWPTAVGMDVDPSFFQGHYWLRYLFLAGSSFVILVGLGVVTWAVWRWVVSRFVGASDEPA